MMRRARPGDWWNEVELNATKYLALFDALMCVKPENFYHCQKSYTQCWCCPAPSRPYFVHTSQLNLDSDCSVVGHYQGDESHWQVCFCNPCVLLDVNLARWGQVIKKKNFCKQNYHHAWWNFIIKHLWVPKNEATRWSLSLLELVRKTKALVTKTYLLIQCESARWAKWATWCIVLMSTWT